MALIQCLVGADIEIEIRVVDLLALGCIKRLIILIIIQIHGWKWMMIFSIEVKAIKLTNSCKNGKTLHVS